MLKAKLSGGFQGKEEDIRISFDEEAGNSPQIKLQFEGDEVTLISDHEGLPNDWDVESLKTVFSIAMHRVLPQADQLVWSQI